MIVLSKDTLFKRKWNFNKNKYKNPIYTLICQLKVTSMYCTESILTDEDVYVD